MFRKALACRVSCTGTKMKQRQRNKLVCFLRGPHTRLGCVLVPWRCHPGLCVPCRDVGNVVEALYGDLPPPIMLIGHSMGGAIAVHTAVANLVPSLLGLCMIDVVEGECGCPRGASALHLFSYPQIPEYCKICSVFKPIPSS